MMGLRYVVLLSSISVILAQGFDPNQVNQQMGGNFDPNQGLGGMGGWGWNQVTTSNPGGASYDPNSANTNFMPLSGTSSPTYQTGTTGGLGWGIDSQWGFQTGKPNGGFGFTLSQVISGSFQPPVGRK